MIKLVIYVILVISFVVTKNSYMLQRTQCSNTPLLLFGEEMTEWVECVAGQGEFLSLLKPTW